jgi:prevent-host-death family protein
VRVTTIGAYEAKTHLPRLLDEVSAGASFTITKHGRPVARLSAVGHSEGTSADVAAALREARRGVTLGGLTVRELVAEGRR